MLAAGTGSMVALSRRNVRFAAETGVMKLEETIAVAIGIVVAISFLAFFLFGGFGISLT
jgi:hypothetical protein